MTVVQPATGVILHEANRYDLPGTYGWVICVYVRKPFRRPAVTVEMEVVEVVVAASAEDHNILTGLSP
jgi:hypothetical protein